MDKETYIFGASTNGIDVLNVCKKNNIKVLGFLDNFFGEGLFENTPVFNPEEKFLNKQVIITSPNFCYDIQKQLESLGYTKILNMAEFYHILNLEPASLWCKDLKYQNLEYLQLKDKLADNESRRVLEAIINFRLTFNLRYLAKIQSKNKQYFDEDFFKPGHHVFVDGGAYDGSTIKEFIKLCPEYRSIYAYEPGNIYNKLRDLYYSFPKIIALNMALSNSKGTTYLSGIGASSHLSKSGLPIITTNIDNIGETITFLKLDVEGSESLAICGAYDQITNHHPFMAISVYHKPQDIWSIPKLIDGIAPGVYQFYLRHYTQFYHETVLYCVSK